MGLTVGGKAHNLEERVWMRSRQRVLLLLCNSALGAYSDCVVKGTKDFQQVQLAQQDKRWPSQVSNCSC